MRRVIIATLIASAACTAPSAIASAAPRDRALLGTGRGMVFTSGRGLEDFGAVEPSTTFRRAAASTWSYDAHTVYAAGTGCTTSIGTCSSAAGELTIGDGASMLTASITGTDDAGAVFSWTATVTGGTGEWRRARGTITVSGTRDWLNDQQTTSVWDLSGLRL